MSDIYNPSKPLSLEAMDAPKRAGDVFGDPGATAPVVPPPGSDIVVAGTDLFFAQATREYDEGLINQVLWTKVLASSAGDKAKAKLAYLRSRATELRLAKRDENVADETARARALPAAEIVQLAGQARVQPASAEVEATARPARKRKRAYMTGIASALGISVLVGLGWLLAVGRAPDTAQPSARTAAPAIAKAAAQGASAQQAAANAATVTNEPPREDWPRKVRELREAGNWNVLVLYATEWTRLEPANATAWNELSAGYVKLRQLDEATAAANKAVQLAPSDATYWRTLGQVNMAADEPDAALRAFEQATTLDDKDVYSFVQTGVINAQSERLPQARAAFDKALATSPDDVQALCGQALIAQKQGRIKDAEALARQLKTLSGKCGDWSEPDTVTRTVRRSASYRPVPAPHR